MYQLLTESKEMMQTYDINGTVGGISFTKENIIRGSFTVTNQCADTSNFGLGGVYIGELSCNFVNITVPRNDWIGLEVIPTITIGETDIPVGVFVINSADHNSGITSIKAYDKMSRFDIPQSVTVGSGGLVYDLLTMACTECHVQLGMTQAEVEELPNGDRFLSIGDIGDIETWRDVLYWISVSTASFCTMDRNGALVLKTYHSEVDDTVPAAARFIASKYGDEIVTYSGLYSTIVDDEKTEYEHRDPDDGYTVNLGTNPFFQQASTMRKQYYPGILEALENIEYVPCEVLVPFGFHYDLGDVLQFPNGSGSSTNKFCVLWYSWTYGGQCKIKSIPTPTKAMSKTDKNIQGLIANQSRNEVAIYEAKNTAPITIGDEENKRIILVRIASNKNTKASIHVEVNLESLANTPTSQIEVDTENNIIDMSAVWAQIAESALKGRVTYLVNSVEDESIHPVETWIDGNHVLHLMYVLGLQQGVASSFEVYLQSLGGTIEIDRGGVWLHASGVGLVGEDKWNGYIEIVDEVFDFALAELTFEDAQDSVVVDFITPETISITDTASGWTLAEIPIESASDELTITLHTYSFPRIAEDGGVRVTEDGTARYTEGD